MDDGSNNSAGENEPRKPDTGKPAAADSASSGDTPQADSHLPIVWSPNLHAGAEFEHDDPPYAYANETASAFAAEPESENANEAAAGAAESLSRSLRFALLAASVASAAALGSFVGSLSAAGVTHLWPAAEESAKPVATNVRPVQATAPKAELAELSALKSSLDGATRAANGQFAKLVDRLDRAERVQIESATKLARVADVVDSVEKKLVTAAATSAAPQTTGSITGNSPAASPMPADAKLSDKMLPDWIVQDVRGGHALVENRYGGVFDVAQGGMLPGLGRVETIKRQDGQWIVVTARGLIAEHN